MLTWNKTYLHRLPITEEIAVKEKKILILTALQKKFRFLSLFIWLPQDKHWVTEKEAASLTGSLSLTFFKVQIWSEGHQKYRRGWACRPSPVHNVHNVSFNWEPSNSNPNNLKNSATLSKSWEIY